ncbi:MAG: hypothetical protein ACJ706_00965 [Nitrososphaeraceae archaeon]
MNSVFVFVYSPPTKTFAEESKSNPQLLVRMLYASRTHCLDIEPISAWKRIEEA